MAFAHVVDVSALHRVIDAHRALGLVADSLMRATNARCAVVVGVERRHLRRDGQPVRCLASRGCVKTSARRPRPCAPVAGM